MTELPCLCASFRRTTRALTQLYDDALRPAGLRSTQMTLLQVLAQTGELSQGDLGRFLAIDSTTLTRTLETAGRRGWILKRPGRDHRERLLRLSRAGRRQLEAATLPLWDAAQKDLRAALPRRPRALERAPRTHHGNRRNHH